MGVIMNIPDWVREHPVSRVIWVPSKFVHANNYNPNTVAVPELELLYISIKSDGFTQPIVVWRVDKFDYEVVDGFHRYRIGVERLKLSHLPVVVVNDGRTNRADRIASTIRHNRARGKHQVAAMSEIVQELARRNWSDQKIGRELGMEPDEVLRLKQISGLSELFADREFSEAWEIVDDVSSDEDNV
jgi:ParB-like chromosome segregation protein Spo0J